MARFLTRLFRREAGATATVGRLPCDVVMTPELRALLLRCVRADSTLWRAEALAAYEQVRDELTRARSRQNALAHEVKIVEDDLDVALEIISMAPTSRWRLWQRLKRYYSGADIEQAWSAIHRANAALHMLYDESELPAQAMRLRNLVDGLPDLKPQLTTLVEELTRQEKPRPVGAAAPPSDRLRAMLREIYEEAIGAAASLQIEARVLRNVLLVASGALFAVLAAFAVTHLADVQILTVCVDSNGNEACPTGDSPSSLDVLAIEAAGMLGGILSMVIPLATGERIRTPYRVFNHQMLLKLMAGAATALAGIVLIESGIISGFTVTDSAEILGYAVFFGFSQQALTGMIDRRATSLAEATPATKSV